MLIPSGTVSVSVNIPGFPSMFVDNRGSFVTTKTPFLMKQKRCPDLKVCDFLLFPLQMQNAFSKLSLGIKIFICYLNFDQHETVENSRGSWRYPLDRTKHRIVSVHNATVVYSCCPYHGSGTAMHCGKFIDEPHSTEIAQKP